MVAVGMSVDQSGVQELVGSVDEDGVFRCRKIGRSDVPDRITLDQQVGGFRLGPGAVEHAPASDDDRPSVTHPTIIPRRHAVVQGFPLPAGDLSRYP